MKIKHANATSFENLSVGTVFKDSDSDLYMKIVSVESYDTTINAVDLENGQAVYFLNSESVVIVDGEFVTNE